MSDNFIFFILLFYLFNIPIYLLDKYIKNAKPFKRILATIDILAFCGIFVWDFYKTEPLFIILIPVILLIMFPLSIAFHKQMTLNELAELHLSKGPPLLTARLIRGWTFPFYFVVKSWSK